MYYNEHNPPHFHAIYGGKRASISISELKLLEGSLHKRAIALVLEWANLHRDELMENWELSRQHKKLMRIRPL